MRTYRILRKKEADRRFPHYVDLRVPVRGLGRGLTDMLDWCRDKCPDWGLGDEHGQERAG